MIYKFNKILSSVQHNETYIAALKSLYTIGWADSPEPEKRTQPCLGSHWSMEDLNRLNLFNSIYKQVAKTKFKKFYKEENLKFIVMNLTKPCDPNFIHTHANQFACLYYVNETWDINWAGETLFFDNKKEKVIETSMYEPNKLVVFDGSIPHTIRAQNIMGPSFRFSLTLIFNKK